MMKSAKRFFYFASYITKFRGQKANDLHQKTTSNGRNMQRVCYVTGHGLTNQRFESFRAFWESEKLEGDHIGVRTKLFSRCRPGQLPGYSIRMVYKADDEAGLK